MTTEEIPGHGEPQEGYPRPPYGYGYPQYGYYAPQQPTGTNGMAIAALVLGICGFLFITSVVGLILGIVALSAVKRSGQRGKGFAISGIVLSVAWIALFATLITVGILNEPDPPKRDAAGTVVSQGAVNPLSLKAGDCFTAPPMQSGAKAPTTIVVVPCATPHNSEAASSYAWTATTYPGQAEVQRESIVGCMSEVDAYVLNTGVVSDGRVQSIYPNQTAWDAGLHHATCFIQFPKAEVTRTVHADDSQFTSDQLKYLKAFNATIEAGSRVLSAPKTASIADLQQLASQAETATEAEISALTSSAWMAPSQPAVGTYVANQKQEAELWKRASAATDVTALADLARQAAATTSTTDLDELHRAIGLGSIHTMLPTTTTDPSS